jgi:hypothetical protein
MADIELDSLVIRDFTEVSIDVFNQAVESGEIGENDISLTPYTDDPVVETQLPTVDNGYTWYRKYKSGWVEQGGFTTAQTITLPIEMADTNYPIQLTGNCSSAKNNILLVGFRDKTTTSFITQGNIVNGESATATNNTSGKMWYVCGMSAQ